MEGKKSFVLYCDSLEILSELADEDAGKLFKIIHQYVTDKDPEINDPLLKIAFLPIKMQLKRDLKKWNNTREKRSEAGKLGGRPKKQDKAKKANALFDNQKKKDKAKKAVNVNDNVNVINNNKAFAADADNNLQDYRKYFFNLIKQYEIRRNELFAKCKIDLSLRNELWESFISNAIINTPLIEDEKHAWNTFKKFVIDNQVKYQLSCFGSKPKKIVFPSKVLS
jgi:hypothetical protein